MRTVKQVLIILVALLTVGQIFTFFYQGSSKRLEPPTITCPEEILDVSARDDESALLSGVSALDSQDGDLTDRVIVGGISKLISSNTAKVTYLVFDNDHNMASCVRQIRYTDYRRPQFAIEVPLIYSTTEQVSVLDRISASDVVDGDISSRILVSTLEPTNNSEVYHISVQVTNSVGDTAQLQLPAFLLNYNPLRPTITLTEQLEYVEKGSDFNPASYLLSVQASGASPHLSDVIIENEVDTSTPGTYYVTYTYTHNGNVGTAILTVVVQ